MAKSKSKIVITGYEEILADIEAIGKETPEVISEALEAQAKNTNRLYKAFIREHEYTGITEGSIVENPKAITNGTKIEIQTGFNIDKGGIASIYLDKGTPKMRPANFIRNIKKNPASIKVFENILERSSKG